MEKSVTLEKNKTRMNTKKMVVLAVMAALAYMVMVADQSPRGFVFEVRAEGRYNHNKRLHVRTSCVTCHLGGGVPYRNGNGQRHRSDRRADEFYRHLLLCLHCIDYLQKIPYN